MTAPPELINMTGHALSGRRYDDEFHNWFVPEYQHGRGKRNLTEVALKAAEFIIDLFASVWSTVGQTTKVPNGKRKYQVKFKYIKLHLQKLSYKLSHNDATSKLNNNIISINYK